MYPDHRTTSRLVTDAHYMASLPLLETEHTLCDPENVYYFGKPTSDFDPEVFVDTSGYEETMGRAIAVHESQGAWLQEYGGIDAEFENPFEAVRAKKRALGRIVGAASAEGFVPLH
jgi:LmbE family N-acetylglucosaminyl deacetylase